MKVTDSPLAFREIFYNISESKWLNSHYQMRKNSNFVKLLCLMASHLQRCSWVFRPLLKCSTTPAKEYLNKWWDYSKAFTKSTASKTHSRSPTSSTYPWKLRRLEWQLIWKQWYWWQVHILLLRLHLMDQSHQYAQHHRMVSLTSKLWMLALWHRRWYDQHFSENEWSLHFPSDWPCQVH